MNFRGEKVERGTNKYVQFTLNARNIDVGSSFLCFGNGRSHWRLFKVSNIACITDIQCYMNQLSISDDIANRRFSFMRRAKASSKATMYFLANFVS